MICKFWSGINYCYLPWFFFYYCINRPLVKDKTVFLFDRFLQKFFPQIIMIGEIVVFINWTLYYINLTSIINCLLLVFIYFLFIINKKNNNNDILLNFFIFKISLLIIKLFNIYPIKFSNYYLRLYRSFIIE